MAIHEEDLSDSARSFQEVVAPVVSEWIGGELVSNEGVMESETAERLDQESGIDVWRFEQGQGTVAVASRIQFGDNSLDRNDVPWNTFTVRYERSSGVETEFQKRKRDLRRPENLVPYYTVQAYLTEPEGEIFSIGMVDTQSLIHFIEENLEGREDERNQPGLGTQKVYESNIPDRWAKFYWVKWWYLLEFTALGNVRTWPKNEPYNSRTLDRYLNTTFADFGSRGES
jgi:hypothetical protein